MGKIKDVIFYIKIVKYKINSLEYDATCVYNSVSDTEMKHVLVNGYKKIAPDFLDKVRDRSEREVRLKNGILDLRTVVEEVQEERERETDEE